MRFSVLLLCILSIPAMLFSQTKLEQTFYYDGHTNAAPWTYSSIDVDIDGVVAVAFTRNISAFNTKTNENELANIIMFDSMGEQIGIISSRIAGMVQMAYGYDGRIYTVENWFGSGMHLYERPNIPYRYVPVRLFNADGSHVDRGTPYSVGVNGEHQIYTLWQTKLCLISTENQLLATYSAPPEHTTKVDVSEDDMVFAGKFILDKGTDTWSFLGYTVYDLTRDGKMLRRNSNNVFERYDFRNDVVEATYVMPPGIDYGSNCDLALGPDGNIYYCPYNSPTTYYFVYNESGEQLLARGADYAQLSITLPKDKFTEGEEVKIDTALINSRELGYVTKGAQLPFDNRPELALSAKLLPINFDEKKNRTDWIDVPVTLSLDKKSAIMTIPEGLSGEYTLKFFGITPVAGLSFLEMSTKVKIAAKEQQGFVTMTTNRNRKSFVKDEAMRLALDISCDAPFDFNNISLEFKSLNENNLKYDISIALEKRISAGRQTIAVTVPIAFLINMKNGDYSLSLVGLPQNIKANSLIVSLVSTVKDSDFVINMHPIFVPSVFDGKLYGAEFNASIVSTYVGSIRNEEANTFMDELTKYNVDFLLQPHTHFAALNSSYNETGAMRQKLAEIAQTFQTYPAFKGMNYHDLISPFGTWWDEQREKDTNPINDAWKAAHPVPENIPEKYRNNYWASIYSVERLPNVYKAWGDAISQVSPDLIRTTQQWWHMPLSGADPDTIAADQDIISTQHMEEQYYHPVTVPNQADLWRISGKPLYVYGNNSWTDDGTGQEVYRESMSGLMRGVQGMGRNDLPQVAEKHSEMVKRTVAPLNALFKVYGGISANSMPVDDVAVWRSLEQEMIEANFPPDQQHIMNTTAAYSACLYAHRTANIITDGKIKAGELASYKALIISCAFEPSTDLKAAIEKFMAAGGKVYANKPINGYWRPEGAVELGALFINSAADPYHNRDFLRFLNMNDIEGKILANALLEAMGNDIIPFATSNEPTTWLTVLQSGDAKYIITANMKLMPHDPFALHRFSGYQNSTMPTKSEIYLRDSNFVAYDVLKGERLTPQVKDGKTTVIADMSYFPGAILAFLPSAVDDIKMQQVTLFGDAATHIAISVLNDKKETINGAIPLEIIVEDVNVQNEDAKTVYKLNRTTEKGRVGLSLNLPPLSADRKYRVITRELLSGIKVTVELPAIPQNRMMQVATVSKDVEYGNISKMSEALQRKIERVAVIASEKGHEDYAIGIKSITNALTINNINVTVLTQDEYLADKKTYGYDKFRIGDYSADVKMRAKRYDLVIMLEDPAQLNKLYQNYILPIPLSEFEPGNGRGLIQYLVMPVYNDEDGISIAGGDSAGMNAAISSVVGWIHAIGVRQIIDVKPTGLPPFDITLTTNKESTKPVGLNDFVGVPAAEIKASKDGKTVAVALKGWGENLFFLNADGTISNSVVSGKFYPMHLMPLDKGFMVLEHDNDPNAMYAAVYSNDGKNSYRLAPTGRRIGGARDYPASHPLVFEERFISQTSYSVTPDERYAAVGGSRGIAVWDLKAEKMLWHDDSMRYDANMLTANGFPQLSLSEDGKTLVVVYDGKVAIKDTVSGALIEEVMLPIGAKIGRVQYNKNNKLVIGEGDYFAFDNGKLMWRFIIPEQPLASAFADNAMDYILGNVDGSVKIMSGGFQKAGYAMTSGVPTSVDILPDSSLVAFGGTTGILGVMRLNGDIVWESNIGSRATVSFIGTAGDIVVSDFKGNVYYYNNLGQLKWTLGLAEKVYRDDINDILVAETTTKTYTVTRPYEMKPVNIPQNAVNIAAGTTNVTFIHHRDWWNGHQFPQQGGIVELTNGVVDDVELPWFDRDSLDNAANVPSAPAWEIARKDGQKMRVNTIVIREDPRHPEAVPTEVKVEAFLNNEWITLVHEYWNEGVSHMHTFDVVEAEKIRYTPVGDLAKNVWLREIELYMIN